MSATRNHNVDVEDLIQLSRDMRQNDLTVQDSKTGSNIANSLKLLNIDLTKVDTFFKDLFIQAEKQDLSYSDLLHTIIEFSQIRKSTKTPFRDALESFRNIFDDTEKVSDERDTLKAEVSSLKVKLETEISDAETTRTKINKFIETRDALSNFGVPLDVYEKLSILFQNVRDLEYDPKQVVNLFSNYQNLTNEKKKLIEDVNQLRHEKTNLSQDREHLITEISEKKELEQSLKLLESQYLTPENTQILTDTIASTGHKFGLTSQESINRLSEEVKNHFYPILSLGEEVTRLKNSFEVKNKQYEALQQNLLNQKVVFDSRMVGLESLKQLNDAGIPDEDIIQWNNILRKQNMDPTTLRQSIEKLGSIESLVKDKLKTLQDLENQINQHNKTKFQLESHLISLTSNTVKEVELNLSRFKTILEDFRGQFLSEKTGFNVETNKILSTASHRIQNILYNTEKTWSIKMDDLSKQLNNIVKEVEETRDKAYETGKEVGQYSTINVMSQLLRGDSVERNNALANMHIMVNRIRSWANQNEEYNLQSLSNNMELEIRRLLQRV